MILSKEQIKAFEAAARPLIEFLNSDGLHPHLGVIVDGTSAEIVEGLARVQCPEFVKD